MTLTAPILIRIIKSTYGTATAFALQVGLDHSAITRICRGKSKISADSLERILSGIEDPRDRSDLLSAWLREHLPESLRTEFTLATGSRNTAKLPALSASTDELLRYWWCAAAADPKVARLLTELRSLRES